jgi:plastocyanin
MRMAKEYTGIHIVMMVFALVTFLAVAFLPKAHTSALAQTHAVQYTASGFTPQTVSIRVGDTVTFSNSGSEILEFSSDPHPFHTSYPSLNLGIINPGTSKSFTFTEVGTFGFHNHVRSLHTGAITVQVVSVTSTPTPTATVTLVPPTNTPIPTQIQKPGDANGDNRVDGIDYVIWLSHYGRIPVQGPLDGDFNRDGTVDGIDYVIWLTHYGN